MKTKLIIPRQRANQDVDDVVTYYLREHAEHAALGFVNSLELAYKYISSHPATGSLRYAHELNLPGLRFWTLNNFPYLVFYIEQSDYIDVLRVLHGKRDIPTWLHDGIYVN